MSTRNRLQQRATVTLCRMNVPELEPLPPSVIAALDRLDGRDGELLDLATPVMSAGHILSTDMVLFAVIQRSLSLVASFVLLCRENQPRVAATLVRMQLDSAMRLNAFWLLENPDDILRQSLEDEPFYKLKSKTGKHLKDAYLHHQLSEKYPGVSTVYEKACKFVHLSQPHMFSFMTAANDVGMEMMLCRHSKRLTEASLLELVGAFDGATTCLIQVCRDYLRSTGRVIPPDEAKLDYEPQRPVRWRWPGWPLALTWLACCLGGACAGAYAATLVFWGEFHSEAWHVIPSRVLAGGGLAAAVTAAILPLARLHSWMKIGIALVVGLCLTFVLTLFALIALWGP